jgi:membrane protease YdiL (CAAX protease family)
LTLASPVPLLPDASVLAGRDLLFALPLGLGGLALLRLGLLRGAGRSLAEPARRPHRRALEGAALAFAALLVVVLVPIAAGAFRSDAPGWAPFAPTPPARNAAGVPASLAFFGVQSLVEELLFRALLLTCVAALVLGLARLTRGPLPPVDPASPRRFGERWLVAGSAANVVQAAGFGALHASNPHVTPLALVNIALAGAVIGWLFWSGAGLAGAWSFHTIWNFGISALGLPVSGMALGTPLVPGPAGAGWPLLTGGAFGPEGSLVTTLALAGLLAALVLRSARRLPTG